MLARIPFGLTTGPIEGAEILVAGCRKETVASEMRSNVLKYRDTLIIHFDVPMRICLRFHQGLNQHAVTLCLRVGDHYPLLLLLPMKD